MARLTYPACTSPRFVEWLDSTTAALDVCGIRRVYRWRSPTDGPVEDLATADVEQPITEESDPALVELVERVRREHTCPGARVRVHGPVLEGRHLRLEICETWLHFVRREGAYVRVSPGE